jgi:hypothetical protein
MVGEKRSARDLGGKAVAKAYEEEPIDNHSNIFAAGDDEDVKKEKVSTVVDAASNNTVADLDQQIKALENNQIELIKLKEREKELDALKIDANTEQYKKAVEELEIT